LFPPRRARAITLIRACSRRHRFLQSFEQDARCLPSMKGPVFHAHQGEGSLRFGSEVDPAGVVNLVKNSLNVSPDGLAHLGQSMLTETAWSVFVETRVRGARGGSASTFSSGSCAWPMQACRRSGSAWACDLRSIV